MRNWGRMKEYRMKDPEPRKTLTITEAAKILGIGRNQAYEAARRGEIPTIKIGKRILVPISALEKKLQGTEP
jgi:excisionase family DNA binding protein